MQKFLIALVALAAMWAWACGGDGGSDDAPTAEPTAMPFDQTLLTGVVLNPNDFPPEYQVSGNYGPDGAIGQSFTSIFVSLGEGLRYQFTVVHYATAAAAEEDFQRNRRVLPGLAPGTIETNFPLEGAEAMFLYHVPSPPGLAAFGVRGSFGTFIQIAPTDYQNPNPKAIDEAEMRRVSGILYGRLQTLIETPELITPIPGAEPVTPAAGSPTAAATP